MILPTLSISPAQIAAFCRKRGVARLSLFGSVLRDDFGPESDIDVLVEFASGKTPSLLTLGAMQQELCDLFGRQVDLKTLDFMSEYVRQTVLREARLQYAA